MCIRYSEKQTRQKLPALDTEEDERLSIANTPDKQLTYTQSQHHDRKKCEIKT